MVVSGFDLFLEGFGRFGTRGTEPRIVRASVILDIQKGRLDSFIDGLKKTLNDLSENILKWRFPGLLRDVLGVACARSMDDGFFLAGGFGVIEISSDPLPDSDEADSVSLDISLQSFDQYLLSLLVARILDVADSVSASVEGVDLYDC